MASNLRAPASNRVGVSLSVAPGNACYIPLGHKTNDNELDKNQLCKKSVLPILKTIFEDKGVLKVGHNIKFDSLVLSQNQNGKINVFPIDGLLLLFCLTVLQ